MLEEYPIKIYKTDPYFYEHYKEKLQTNKNKSEYIPFRIDVCFSEYLLAVQIDGKSHTDRDLISEEKRQKALEKKLACKFIRINTSKYYDEDYEIGRIQTFISKFKKRQLKKNRKRIKQKNKRTSRRNKKLTLKLTSQTT